MKEIGPKKLLTEAAAYIRKCVTYSVIIKPVISIISRAITPSFRELHQKLLRVLSKAAAVAASCHSGLIRRRAEALAKMK